MSLDTIVHIHEKLQSGKRITKSDTKTLCKYGVVLYACPTAEVIHSDEKYVYVAYNGNRVRKSEYASVDFDNTTSTYITFNTTDGKLVTARMI